MRLKRSLVSANEELVALVNGGYGVLNNIEQDYGAKKADRTYREDADNARYEEQIEKSASEVASTLAGGCGSIWLGQNWSRICSSTQISHPDYSGLTRRMPSSPPIMRSAGA